MPNIGSEMSVREINRRFPACRVVFARYGMGGCGGDQGPDEPLDFFARAHQVDLDTLVQELEQASEEALADTISPALEFERRLAWLYRTYIRTSLAIALSFGTVWGVLILLQIAMAQSFAAPDYAGTQAHGHAQVYGWVGLFIMGVAYFSVPKFMQTKLPALEPGWTAYGLMLLGIVLRAIAQPLAGSPVFGALVLVSAIAELVAVMIFVADLALVLWQGMPDKRIYLPFIQASLVWLVALAGWNLMLVEPLWHGSAQVIPDPANSRFLYLGVYGFIANMILGYSLRLLPIFLGLRQVREKLVLPAFVLFNAGVAARLPGWDSASGLLTFAGMVTYVAALRIFEPPKSAVKARGVDASFPWFIRLAYFWFVASIVMVLGGDLYRMATGAALGHFYTGAWRHAVTVGFVSTIMVGLGYRLLPLFTGVDLWKPHWMRPAFWLLACGNTLRVTFELATASGASWTYLVMGTSGVLELSALSLFSISLWNTLSLKQQVLVTGEQINPKTKVRWLLDHFPQARPELIRAGFIHLEKAGIVPAFVTLEQAAAVHGIGVEGVVEHMRAALQLSAVPAQPVLIQIHTAAPRETAAPITRSQKEMTNPIAVLRKEHDAIVRMLGVAEVVAHKLTRGEAVAPETLFGLQEFFITFADTCHHGKEEGLLFPLLEKKGIAKNGGPLGIMLMEHDESREFVQQMKQSAADYAAGKPKAGDRWAVAASSYSEILRQHIFKENNVLFCMAERILSDAEQAELASAFDKVETERMGGGTHERIHALMNKLLAEVMPKAS